MVCFNPSFWEEVIIWAQLLHGNQPKKIKLGKVGELHIFDIVGGAEKNCHLDMVKFKRGLPMTTEVLDQHHPFYEVFFHYKPLVNHPFWGTF